MNYQISVRIAGVLHDWDEFTEEEKRDIGIRLNDQAMRSIGFVPKRETIKKQKTA